MSEHEERRPRIEAAEFEALIHQTIPLTRILPFRVQELDWGSATIRLLFSDQQLRAGGTINGPTMMTLADTALYAAVLTRIGMEPLAVTSDLTIHFLRKPEPRDLIGRATVLRAGRRIAVGTIEISSVDGPLVAHATGSYALP
ncbi:PaaI family thioesterase [Sandaracinus amylolyticus]|uniref:PaaI family thioesterase n=1 Tax=Sandaracinus amylolyticus TaxID=927083 RepID=UPI001969F2E9|nr:PaaI family thioesterase [Sandaracinus amylolyticus]